VVHDDIYSTSGRAGETDGEVGLGQSHSVLAAIGCTIGIPDRAPAAAEISTCSTSDYIDSGMVEGELLQTERIGKIAVSEAITWNS